MRKQTHTDGQTYMYVHVVHVRMFTHTVDILHVHVLVPKYNKMP